MFKKNKSRMVFALALALAAVLALGSLFGCSAETPKADDSKTPATTSPTGAINVLTREDGSGTRSAFVELFEVQVDKDGKKVDAITSSAATFSSTSVMLTTVAGDDKSIGYISLGSLDSIIVKALKIDGVEATTANVKSGSYKISRPFNIATKGDPSPAAQDFINFIMSAEGQKVVGDNHYIAVDDKAPAYTKSSASGTIVVGGSSSVFPVMEKLKEAYEKVNTDVKVSLQQSDSSVGMTSTIDGVYDIGMSSRALKDSETSAGLKDTKIAIDGLAVIVSTKNTLSGLTKEKVKEIFLGTITDWKNAV